MLPLSSLRRRSAERDPASDDYAACLEVYRYRLANESDKRQRSLESLKAM
jgi:hypothetical protein